ncbi:MAG: hypothetical protein JWR80_6694 [Bradyrhizobium sp.]|nr:hypothetical protein [Bradyrhizobium sp.]
MNWEMVCLSDDLAAIRRLYARPIVTMPDIMVIEIAARYRHPSLSMGRYYAIMIESDAELHEVNDFLRAVRPAPVAPALLDRRPTAVAGDRITIAVYAPPERDWPWLLLCHWPGAFAALAPAGADMFARGAYTIEMFEDEVGSVAGARGLLASLGRHSDVKLTLITRERLPKAGQA